MVAMNVWPTDGAAGSVATEAQWRKMGRIWTPSGVAAGIGGSMKPTLAGTNLTIKSGACWVDGHFAELLGDQVLTVTANGLAVVRFDPAANTADLVYRDAVSVPAQSPTGTWELAIAQIVGSALVDLRLSVGYSNLVIHAERRALTTDAFGDFAIPQPAGIGTVIAAFAAPFYDTNMIILHRNANLNWKARYPSLAVAPTYALTVDVIIVGVAAAGVTAFDDEAEGKPA